MAEILLGFVGGVSVGGAIVALLMGKQLEKRQRQFEEASRLASDMTQLVHQLSAPQGNQKEPG